MVRVVILLGPPGAGKGTQAKRLGAELSLPHISTGDLFRENLKNDTELGRKAKGYMADGGLVPDELVLDMLFDRVDREDCAGGYLLDGFPRTVAQAEALDARLEQLATSPVVTVPELVVPDELILERITGRRTCAACGNIQHVKFDPPKVDGTCDACGGQLEQRADDKPEVVAERLEVYHAQTAPIVDHYGPRGIVTKIDGTQTPDEVFADLIALVPQGENA